MTDRNVTVQEQPSSPTIVLEPETDTSYNGGNFISSVAIMSDVSSHDATLAIIFVVEYPSYERTKFVR